MIANNTTRAPKDLWTAGDAGVPADPLQGGGRVRRSCMGRSRPMLPPPRSEGLPTATSPSSTAPTPSSRILEEELAREGLATGSWEAPASTPGAEVKDMLAYLCVAANPRTTVSAGASSTSPARGVGDPRLDRLARLGPRRGRLPAGKRWSTNCRRGNPGRCPAGSGRIPQPHCPGLGPRSVTGCLGPGALIEVRGTAPATVVKYSEAEDELEAPGAVENMREL